MKRGVSKFHKSKVFNFLNIILIALVLIEVAFVVNEGVLTGQPVRSAGLGGENAVASISSFQQVYGINWKIESDSNNVPIKLSGGNVPVSQITGKQEKITKDNIDAVSKTFIDKNKNLLYVDSSSLKVSRVFSDSNSKPKVIRYNQEYRGVPIYNSYTTLAYIEDALTFYKTNYEPSLQLDTIPQITKEEALNSIKRDLSVIKDASYLAETNLPDGWIKSNLEENKIRNIEPSFISVPHYVNINPEKTELVILPLDIIKSNGNKLAWKIDLPLDKINNEKITYFVDAKTGNILYKLDNVVYATVSGNVQGKIYPNTPIEGFEIRSFDHERVIFSSSPDSYTTNEGYVIDTIELSGRIDAGLEGLYVYVNDYQQPNAHFQSEIINPPAIQDIDWSTIDSSYKQEESNVFYHANLVHDFFTKGGSFDMYSMDFPMWANVEIGGICNAYADGSSINFFMAGEVSGWGFCEATSLGSDIIYHEYTHNVVFSIYDGINLPYVGETGGMNEGWADYFAATITNDPVMGENIFPTPIRNLENNLRYPNDYNPEPHAASTVFSPALWEIRQTIGAEAADALVLNAMKLNPMTFSEFVEAMIIVDDDNGNLNDGTPNIGDICHAFYDNHGIFSNYCRDFVEIPVVSVTSPFSNEVVVGSIPIIGEIYPSKYGVSVEYTLRFGDVEFGHYNGEEFIGSLGNIDTSSLSDGVSYLTIDALDSGGKFYNFSIPLEVDNLQVTSPKEGETLRPGKIIEIKGSVILGDNERYSFQWIGGDVNMWTTEGITLVDDGLTSVQNGTLGFWDTTNIKSGSYALYLWKLGEGDVIILDDFWIYPLYFDSSLKEGWPIKIEWPIYDCPNPYGCMYWSGDLAPVVEDINKDNIKEIILAIRPNKLLVLEPDGTSLAGFPKELPFDGYGGNYGMFNPIPVVGDVNKDGFKEIFIQGHHYNNENGYFSLIIYGFNYDGTPLPGWPNDQQVGYLGQQASNSPVIADLDNDGFPEIIVQSYQKLIIFDRFGNFLNQNWPVEIIPSIGSLSTPAVGNLDNDPELEIATVSTTTYDMGTSHITKIYAFNLDGSSVSGWPIEIQNSVVYGSPVIGDINNDGNNEIIIGFFDLFDYGNLGGVYAFKNNGELLSNWPKLIDKSIFSSPALKKNSAGNLEIVVETFPSFASSENPHEIWLFNYTGQGRLINASPYIGGNVFSPILIDIDNDNETDIITASNNQILAFSNHGQIISGFTKEFREADTIMTSQPILEDIDNDGRLELIKSSSTFMNDYIYVWDLNASYNPLTMEWPQFQHDAQHTGLYGYEPKSYTHTCADLNSDGVRDIIDVSLLINHAFRNGPEPQPKWIADLNADNVIDILDVSLIINHAFRNGPVPSCTATQTTISSTGTISLGAATGTTTSKSIPVYLTNAENVAGTTFKVSYDSLKLYVKNIRTASRTSNMQIIMNGNSFTLIKQDGSQTISKGSGVIAYIDVTSGKSGFDTSSLKITEVKAANPDAKKIAVSIGKTTTVKSGTALS